MKNHMLYYLSLIVMLSLGFSLIYMRTDSPQIQKVAFMLTAFCYVLWGIVHHLVHHDMSVRVVLEYVLIGALGIALGILIL